ncbi:hypothetical protein A3Q56_01845 [Intoshia linei]|uniref:WD repeat-containing protein 64 n=1 Tax=Intoshia linei TaxID=1819745 RepID=A0A177B8E3_9BILA|nr:hypothetical protein A3Q56_01845 [Intoshia linei]
MLVAPTGKLYGHLFTIIAFTVNESDQHLISLSTARIFHVWDIHTYLLLQVFADTEERLGERRIYSIIFNNKTDLLIMGSSVIDTWALVKSSYEIEKLPHTHDCPLVHIFINDELNQVVTICTESIIKVWQIWTGEMLYKIIFSPIDKVNITCGDIDDSGYRFVVGSSIGLIKLFEFTFGHELKTYSLPHRVNITDSLAYSISFIKFIHDSVRKIVVCETNGRITFFETCYSFSSYIPEIQTKVFKDIINQDDIYININQKFTDSALIAKQENLFVSQKHYELYNNDKLIITHNDQLIVMNIKKFIVEYILKNPNQQSRLSSGSMHNINVSKVSRKSGFSTVLIEQSYATKCFQFESIIVTGNSHHRLDFYKENESKCIFSLSPKLKKLPEYVTAITADENKTVLFSADRLGYVVKWSIEMFLENFDETLIQEETIFRAHLSCIVDIKVKISEKVSFIVTASVDGSVRIWNAKHCQYIGFYGQSQNIYDIFISKNDKIYPDDINEPSITFQKSKFDKNKPRNIAYPLKFNEKKWSGDLKLTESNQYSQYFSLLINSKSTKYSIDTINIGDLNWGNIFRHLPIYTINQIAKPKTPDIIKMEKKSEIKKVATIMVKTKKTFKNVQNENSIFNNKLPSIRAIIMK